MEETLREELLEEESRRKGPLRIILGIFLLLLIIMWTVPMQTIPLNPEPSKHLGMNDAVSGLALASVNASPITGRKDYVARVDSTSQNVKIVADRIVSAGCKSSRVCHAKALYYFVRDELNYVNDPLAFEYVKHPLEALQSTAGDCDDASVLLSSLLSAVGIRSRFVFVPGHVYVEAWIPEALNKYKRDGSWIVLDGTCKDCEFGELALSYVDLPKSYMEVP